MHSPSVIPFAFDSALVRVVLDDVGEPWFCAKDVGHALGYQWSGIRTIQHVPDEWKKVESVSTTFGTKDTWFLSEQGLYFFLGRSDKPGALPFQKWLAGDVLPSIRKNGGYALPSHPALESPAPRCALPDVPEMYHLRPTLRQRLWQDALQTARWTTQAQTLRRSGLQPCAAMVVGHAPRDGVDETTRRILQFADERCRAEHNGRVSAAALYDAFTLWWCSRFDEPAPSQQMFGRVMCGRYVQRKRGGKSCYFGVRLAARGRNEKRNRARYPLAADLIPPPRLAYAELFNQGGAGQSRLAHAGERPGPETGGVFEQVNARHPPCGSPYPRWDNPFPPNHQTGSLMDTLCKRAGVKPFGFHAIRHCSAAVTFKAVGLNGAQVFLGHSRATTTDRYVRSAGLYGSQDGILAALGALPQRRGHSILKKKWAYQLKLVCPSGQLLFSDQRKEEKALWKDC